VDVADDDPPRRLVGDEHLACEARPFLLARDWLQQVAGDLRPARCEPGIARQKLAPDVSLLICDERLLLPGVEEPDAGARDLVGLKHAEHAAKVDPGRIARRGGGESAI